MAKKKSIKIDWRLVLITVAFSVTSAVVAFYMATSMFVESFACDGETSYYMGACREKSEITDLMNKGKEAQEKAYNETKGSREGAYNKYLEKMRERMREKYQK
jgi:hypothetical protein